MLYTAQKIHFVLFLTYFCYLQEGKLVQKLMVDEKRCYLFGRNSQLNDFTVDHGSCSRVHAALVYHKHLGRTFLVDCGSTHGMKLSHFYKPIVQIRSICTDNHNT